MKKYPCVIFGSFKKEHEFVFPNDTEEPSVWQERKCESSIFPPLINLERILRFKNNLIMINNQRFVQEMYLAQVLYNFCADFKMTQPENKKELKSNKPRSNISVLGISSEKFQLWSLKIWF